MLRLHVAKCGGALVRRGVDNYVIPEDGETVIY